MQRRRFLKATTSLVVTETMMRWLEGGALGATQKLAGTSQPFDYAALKGRARSLALAPYTAPVSKIPPAVKNLDWDQYQSIRHQPNEALWAGDNLDFQVKFFHLGLYYETPVRMYEVVNGHADEIAYDPAMFDYGKTGLAGVSLPKDMGFAGFRINFHTDLVRDVAAFLGASYFRAVGGQYQYGLSARGLAVDCGMNRPEEFPVFTAFWFERPKKGAPALTVYALLDSPSVAGAYRFILRPGTVFVMDVDAALYPRKEIERVGIAPLTSMFQFGENDHRVSDDWRPEIHDSDGLSMWTGNGEWIWRPLTNPSTVRFSAHADENPRGFGLLQRDRLFDHYQDDGVYYDRRPSLWVEPRGGWGKGSIDLVELPAKDETIDNIGVFWNPEKRPEPGQELLFAYRLHWGATVPQNPPLARTVATRVGVGGIVGQKHKYYSRRFAIDFAGPSLTKLAPGAQVEPVITASRGHIEITSARPLESIHGYRAMFDVRPSDTSQAPIELRLFLRSAGKPLTETWMYQWTPAPEAARGDAT